MPFQKDARHEGKIKGVQTLRALDWKNLSQAENAGIK
jgi:hypothetical protein